MMILSIQGKSYQFNTLGELRKFLDFFRKFDNVEMAYGVVMVRRNQLKYTDTRKIKIKLR